MLRQNRVIHKKAKTKCISRAGLFIIFEYSAKKASGKLELEKATVNWLLSIDEKNLPETARLNNEKKFRQLKINGTSLDFTNGFSDLHSLSYQQILNGSGIKLSETKKVIQLVSEMRS